MLRLLALVLLSLSYFQLVIGSPLTKAQLEGRPCMANQTMGVYKPLKQCPSLYKKWLQTNSAANVPDDGIWCCPNEATNNRKRSIRAAPTPYAKAKAKCEEYSRLENASSISPAATIDKQPSLSSSGKAEAQSKEFSIVATIGFTSVNGTVFVCSGSVISPRFVLTAAHCTSNTYFADASDFWVRVGDVNLNSTDDDANAQQIRVIERIRNPLYHIAIGYHDIGLLKLEKDINFNEWVKPACLPYSLPDNAAPEVTAVGQGIACSHSPKVSNELIKVTRKLVPQLECNDSYNRVLPAGVMADWQLCAGGQKKMDIRVASGGPLITVNNEHPRMYSLIGITSMGKDCNGVTPVIYSRVYYYIPWIESIVWPNS